MYCGTALKLEPLSFYLRMIANFFPGTPASNKREARNGEAREHTFARGRDPSMGPDKRLE